MPSVSQIAQRRAATSLDLGDGVIVNLEFYPDRVSPYIMRQFVQLQTLFQFGISDNAKAESMEDVERLFLRHLDGLADIIATLVASWDLTEEDGPMVALSRERLTQFGFIFLFQVFAAVWGGLQMGETKGTTSRTRSNGISPRKAR